MQDRLRGVLEIGAGTIAATSSIWGKLFDVVIIGAHSIAIIGGAFVAAHGVWKIVKPKRRRGTDRTLSLSEES